MLLSYDAACSKCAVGLQSVFLLFILVFVLARGSGCRREKDRTKETDPRGVSDGVVDFLSEFMLLSHDVACSICAVRLQSSFLFLFSFLSWRAAPGMTGPVMAPSPSAASPDDRTV